MCILLVIQCRKIEIKTIAVVWGEILIAGLSLLRVVAKCLKPTHIAISIPIESASSNSLCCHLPKPFLWLLSLWSPAALVVDCAALVEVTDGLIDPALDIEAFLVSQRWVNEQVYYLTISVDLLLK